MKKKVLSIVMALSLMVGLLPTMALAAELPAPDTNGTITISESMELTNVSITGTISVYEAPLLSITGNAVVTIDGGTISLGDSTQGFAIQVTDNAQLTLKNVTVTGYHAAIRVKDNATLTVDGGSITGTEKSSSLSGDGIRAYGSSKVTIGGSCVVNGTTDSGAGVELYETAEVTIESGATVNGEWGVTVYGGALESAGNITGDDCGIIVSSNVSGNTGEKSVTVTGGKVTGGASGGAVWVAKSAVEDTTNATDVDLTGGEFTGAITVETSQSSSQAEVDLTITGGTFQNAQGQPITDNSLDSYFAPGLKLENGKVVRENGDLTATKSSSATGLGVVYDITGGIADRTYVVQVTSATGAIGISAFTLDAADGKFQVSGTAGSTFQIWETTAMPGFEDGAPNLPYTAYIQF